MMRCKDVRPELSLYIDDLLDPQRRANVRAHLLECASCADVASDLEHLTTAAQALGPIAPPRHLWPDIARQLPAILTADVLPPARPPRDPWAWMGVPASVVAATLLLYATTTHPPAAPDAGTSGGATVAVEAATNELGLAVHHYERAIAELETLAVADETLADPTVVAALRQSLATLDTAIAESRQALDIDPGNGPARASLFEALRQKVGVLQATVLLTNGMR